jgi:hypothetical protein
MRYWGIVLVATIAGCSSSPKEPARPKPIKGYAMSQPSGWGVRTGVRGADVTYVSPKEGDDDAFRENISVRIQMMPPKMDAPSYQAYKLSMFKKNLVKFKVEEQKPVKVGLVDGTYLRYSFTGRPGPMTSEDYTFVKKGMIYTITCEALASSYERYKESFDIVLGTLRM